jgi:proteic killer suppression protein
MTIKRFYDKRTAALFVGKTPKGIGADVVRRAKAKLDLIDAAAVLDFLRSPPGNHLEALEGDRAGEFWGHSTRLTLMPESVLDRPRASIARMKAAQAPLEPKPLARRDRPQCGSRRLFRPS